MIVVFDEQHLSSIKTEEVRRRLEPVWKTLGAANVLLASTGGGGTGSAGFRRTPKACRPALLRFRGSRQPEAAGKVSDYEAFLISARRDDRVLVEVYRRYLDMGLIHDPTQIDTGERQSPASRASSRRRCRRPAAASSRRMRSRSWSDARRRQAATWASLQRLLDGLAGTPGRKAVGAGDRGVRARPGGARASRPRRSRAGARARPCTSSTCGRERRWRRRRGGRIVDTRDISRAVDAAAAGGRRLRRHRSRDRWPDRAHRAEPRQTRSGASAASCARTTCWATRRRTRARTASTTSRRWS